MKTIFIGIIVGVSAILFYQGPFRAQEQPKIHERVEVVNMEVLVRALDKEGVPVAGLKREDFRIEEGRVPVEINGFTEIKKKIAVAGPVPRRLFALFFNVGNPRPDLDKAVDMFFEKIFKPGDRLMVMTNRFSIADHVVTEPARERETIRVILLTETRDFASRLGRLEQNLQSLTRDMTLSLRSEENAEEMAKGSGIGIPEIAKETPGGVLVTLRRFYAQYLQYFDEYKEGYLTLSLGQYARMAEYLKNQDAEKYALVFYQQGVFPFISDLSPLQHFIDKAMLRAGDLSVETMMLSDLQADVQTQLLAPKGPSEKEIGKLFLNSGITVHTLLLLPPMRRQLNDMQYLPVATGPESVLGKLAEMTNGVLASYVKYTDFFRRVGEQEDVYYQITFSPASGRKNRAVKVSLIDNKKKLRLVYDNQRQPRYIRERIDQEQEIPQVAIKKVSLSGKTASVSVAGYGREDLHRQQPLGGARETQPGPGKVALRWRAWDKENKEVFDQIREYLPEAEKMEETLALPDLPEGTYDLIVEALDRNTGRNDLTIRSVAVDGTGEYRQLVSPKEPVAGTGGESGCLAMTGKEREECFKQLAQSYLAWGEIIEAAKYYEQSGDENRSAGLNRIGDSFYDKGETENALIYYERAEPTINRVRVYTTLADRYGQKEKKTLALYYYRNAAADFEALVRSANAYLDDYDRKENERCRQEIEKLEKTGEKR